MGEWVSEGVARTGEMTGRWAGTRERAQGEWPEWLIGIGCPRHRRRRCQQFALHAAKIARAQAESWEVGSRVECHGGVHVGRGVMMLLLLLLLAAGKVRVASNDSSHVLSSQIRLAQRYLA